jgi:hypothetical protein
MGLVITWLVLWSAVSTCRDCRFFAERKEEKALTGQRTPKKVVSLA